MTVESKEGLHLMEESSLILRVQSEELHSHNCKIIIPGKIWSLGTLLPNLQALVFSPLAGICTSSPHSWEHILKKALPPS